MESHNEQLEKMIPGGSKIESAGEAGTLIKAGAQLLEYYRIALLPGEILQVASRILMAPAETLEFSAHRKALAALDERIREGRSALLMLQKKMQVMQSRTEFESAGEELAGLNSSAGNVRLYIKQFSDEDNNKIKAFGDEIKRSFPFIMSVFLNQKEDKLEILVMVSKELTAKKYHAGNFIRQLLEHVQGRGGGKPEMAQGGGVRPENTDKFVELIRKEFSLL